MNKTIMSRLFFKFERGKRNCRKKNKRFKFVVKEIKIKIKLFEKLGHGLVEGGGDGGDSLRATLYNNLLLLCWIKECPLGTAEPKHFRYILTKYYPLGGKWLRLCAFYFFSSIFPRPTYFSVVIDCWLYMPQSSFPPFLLFFFFFHFYF